MLDRDPQEAVWELAGPACTVAQQCWGCSGLLHDSPVLCPLCACFDFRFSHLNVGIFLFCFIVRLFMRGWALLSGALHLLLWFHLAPVKGDLWFSFCWTGGTELGLVSLCWWDLWRSVPTARGTAGSGFPTQPHPCCVAAVGRNSSCGEQMWNKCPGFPNFLQLVFFLSFWNLLQPVCFIQGDYFCGTLEIA